MLPILLALLVWSATGMTQIAVAQERQSFTVRGRVLDKESGETVPGVNVYLANTILGASSGPEGEFAITGIPPGVYRLVVSHITYGNYSRVISTDSLEAYYRVEVEPMTRELGEIVVSSSREEWQQNYEQFMAGFLGPSDFAEQTQILNPEILRFDFNPDSLILRGYAEDVLEVENRALGYLVEYNLKHFSIRYRENQIFLAGESFFRELTPSGPDELQKWQENRRKAYYGSFDHFVHTLLAGTTHEEDFLVNWEEEVEGSRRMNWDLQPVEEYITRSEHEILVHFSGNLRVRYLREWEDRRFLRWVHAREAAEMQPQRQESYFFVMTDTMRVDGSGYVYDPLTVVKGGYWSYEKIPYLLPFGYRPELKSEDRGR